MKVKSESEVAQLCPTRSNPMDCSLSCVQLCATPWTVTHQAPLSTEFSGQ